MTSSQADIEKAYKEARDLYQKNMQRQFGPDTRSTSEEAVVGAHSRELTAAQENFKANIENLPNGEAKAIKDKLKILTEELNQRLDQFLDKNSTKSKIAVHKGKAAYTKSLRDQTHEQFFCLHPRDVEYVHENASTAAQKAFDEIRIPHLIHDWDRHYLVDYIERTVIGLRILNTKNNKLIIAELTKKYFNEIVVKVNQRKLSEAEFSDAHERSRARAVAEFDKKRNRTTDRFAENPFKSMLEQAIMLQYSHLKVINQSDVKEPFKSAPMVYDANNRSPVALRERCLHPEDLRKDHEEAACKALKSYRPDRSCSDGFDAKKADSLLHLLLESRYKVLAGINGLANEVAEEAAFLEFTKKFNELTNRYFYRWNGIKQTERREKLDQARTVAFKLFYKTRRDGQPHASDIYVENLKRRTKGYAVVFDVME